MNYGAATRFEVKHGAKGGIFWQKEAPKQKPRKYGYKSKDLRHPIRKPEEEYMAEPVKKTKPSKDFVKKNRQQFQPHQKEEDKENQRGGSSAGRPSSEIKPGTVTLTQDQLNALLATVGKLKPEEVEKLNISIDAESNELKIDSPRNKPDSRDSGRPPSGSGKDEHEEESSASPNHRKPEAGNNKTESVDKKSVEKEVRFNSARNEVQHLKPEKEKPPLPPAALVPWRHMTVAERKRLEWARQKADEEELGNFDPWGRPGAGAPPKKVEPQPVATELLTDEERNLRKAIDDIEAKYGALLSQASGSESAATKTKQVEDSQGKTSRQSNAAEGGRSSQASVSKSVLEDKGNSRPSKKHQNRTDEQKERKGAAKKEERKSRASGQDKKGKSREDREHELRKMEEEQEKRVAESRAESENRMPASMQTSMRIGQSSPDNSKFLSKKEEERKKWIEELDRQREEKRMQKEREQMERRAGGADDTWADRFVQQPPPRPSIRMHPHQATATQELMAPSAASGSGQGAGSFFSGGQTDPQNAEMPPAAMRTSMMIGGIAPNDEKIRNKQEEEKRLWLEELNKQREEQREARMKLKDRQRASEETWADRFTQDPRANAVADRSPRVAPNIESQHAVGQPDGASGRISSAPQPQPTSVGASISDDHVTFIRGQNVYMDPVTRHQLEEKRRKHLEYQDPIMNPGLVKDFPTARQDQILQQLSSLKQSLIQRQREIETCMSPSDLEK